MDNDNEGTSPTAYINGLVAAMLDDVAERPVPRTAEARLARIREAVAEGNATVDMAIDVVALFPDEKAA